MTAKKTGNRQQRKEAYRKLLKGLTAPIQGGFKMARIKRGKK